MLNLALLERKGISNEDINGQKYRRDKVLAYDRC